MPFEKAGGRRSILDGVVARVAVVIEKAAQFAQRIHLDLAHPFAGHAEFLADFLERTARMVAQAESAHHHVTLFLVELVQPLVDATAKNPLR